VIQGAQEMGRTAAHLLDQMLHGVRMSGTRVLVPPVGINVLASTQHEAPKHPHVMRARHFIRQYACQGIKTHQVAEYVGISRSSLESYFRQELNCSVHDVILRFARCRPRCWRAVSAASPRWRCAAASPRCSMHAVFKRELGCTPRTYQDRAMLGNLDDGSALPAPELAA
jgi:LacI family transcriptional regulator